MTTPILSIVKNTKNPTQTRQNKSTHRIMAELDIDRQGLLELSNKLHSTLDLDQLITLFKLEISPLLDLDEMIYYAPQERQPIPPKGRHMLSYQLVLHHNSLGELAMIRRSRFNAQEQAFVEKVLVALLAPLNNALNYQQALHQAWHDPLTGIYNRYAMDNMVAREVELAQRNSTPLSMIALDIDFFKNVNDTHGHALGDCVLKHLAQCIQQCTRSTDAIFRYGGEEFNLLLNNTDLSGARELAERIRQKIEQSACVCDGISIHITASMGISVYHRENSLAEFFKQADDALYQAKSAGRNQVVCHSKW